MPERPNVTLHCDHTGFKPTLTHLHESDRSVNVTITLGVGGPGCNVNKFMNATDNQITVNDINTDNSNSSIPYTKDGSNVSCGASMDNSTDGLSIEFKIGVKVVVTETIRNVIRREQQYEWLLKCEIERDVIVNTNNSWTIQELLTSGEKKTVNKTFDLPLKLMYYDADWNAPQIGNYTVAHNEYIYMNVKQDPVNDAFHFVVEKCWVTPDPNPNNGVQDTFFDNKCPVDRTVVFNNSVEQEYRIKMKSFFFVIDTSKTMSIYTHCELLICMKDDKVGDCKQPTEQECGGTRKRRSVDDRHVLEERTISTQGYVILDNTEIITPACKEGHVYDRISRECTNEQILEVKGVYLDIDWNPKYANTSSEEFTLFAREKEYQLYALLQTESRNRIITGVKVVGATKGSVILTVQITYAKTSSASDAFQEFEKAITTSKSTENRVMKILNIRQDKTIEYVPVTSMAETRMDKVTLVIVVVVLLVVLFISGLTFYKVKQLRGRSTATTKKANGFENMGMDNVI